jgi:hypothetical protein
MSILTKAEKENLVLELHSLGKTYPEIAKEARISVRDIKPILVKAESEQSLSASSQAYKLFSEDQTATQVAIALDIRQPQATEFFTEYWKLQQLDQLYQIFQEIKNNMYFFIQLYRQAKAAGMNVQDIIRVLRIAKNDLRSIEYRFQELRKREASLQAGNQNAARTFQELSDQISEEYKTLNKYRSLVEQKKQEVQKLNQQKMRLELLIECFLNSNEAYLSIKETIKREVEHILAEPKQLLKFALISIIKSSRNDPKRFYGLCYNMNIPATTLATQSPSISGDNSQFDYMPFMNEQNISSDYNNDNEAPYEEVLLAESEALYNKIVDEVINKTNNGAKDGLWNTFSSQPDTELSNLKKETSQDS